MVKEVNNCTIESFDHGYHNEMSKRKKNKGRKTHGHDVD